jgi:hypothetical protein
MMMGLLPQLCSCISCRATRAHPHSSSPTPYSSTWLKPVASLPLPPPLTHTPIHPPPPQVFSLSADKTIKMWDLRNHKCLQTITEVCAGMC